MNPLLHSASRPGRPELLRRVVGFSSTRSYSRRKFLRHSILATAGFWVLKDSASVASAQANEKLNIGLIGIGGRGNWFVGAIPDMGENLAAFCEVNDVKNPSAHERFPHVKTFHDYRQMLEEMDRELDAIVVAAPDHIHAPAAIRAMKMGKPVYCEKPLTNSVNESRRMRQVARETKMATQMGNQGTASEGYRRAVEIIQAGLLGEIREVFVWKDSGGPDFKQLPDGAQPVPDFLKWDLWLGPAAFRPYHPHWMRWHGWREFGTCNLGNWAPHSMNLAFRALKLDALWADEAKANSIAVQAEVSSINRHSFPQWEIVRYEVPARGDLPPVRVTWMNGSRAPKQRQIIEESLGRKLDWGDAGQKKWEDHAGTLVVGSKGRLHSTSHNTSFTLLPEGEIKAVGELPVRLPQSPGHEKEWVNACKGGPPAMSNFDYAGPLTEFCLLGNVATQFPDRLEFDPTACRITNHTEANTALHRDHRAGWEI